MDFLERDLPKVAKKIKSLLSAGDVVGFSGQLAAGKTTVISELARTFGYTGRTASPTFVLEHRYPLKTAGRIKEIIHLDLYRLNTEDFGFFDRDDYRNQPTKIIFVEWPERLPPGLLNFTKTVTIEILHDKKRRLTVSEHPAN